MAQQSINPTGERPDEPLQFVVMDAGLKPLVEPLNNFDDAWLVYQTHEEADKVEVL